MRNFLGVKCCRKASHLDENQESLSLKLVEKSSVKPYRKYVKVHPDTSPTNPFNFVKEASQNQDQPQNHLLPERSDGNTASKIRSVRVVVTKKQLKQMLKNAEALKAMGISVQFTDSLGEKGGTSPRWRPSLASIAE